MAVLRVGPMNVSSLNALQSRLGHQFADLGLLREALTHPSVEGPTNYQRLEFLGDRVLGLFVAERLFSTFSEADEGVLASRYNTMVRREALSETAVNLELGKFIILAPSEQARGSAENAAILADCCEALIGALYQDGGQAVAWQFIECQWQARLLDRALPAKDAKTALQEWSQARGLGTPVYREAGRTGPDHRLSFSVVVELKGIGVARGEGAPKRQAEQAAAAALLDQMQERDIASQ